MRKPNCCQLSPRNIPRLELAETGTSTFHQTLQKYQEKGNSVSCGDLLIWEMSRLTCWRPAVLSSSSCQTYTVDVGRSNERKRIGNEYVYCPRWCISWHTFHAAKSFAASRRSCMFEPRLGHLLITSAHVQAIKPTMLGSVGLVQAIRTVSTVQGVT